MSYDVVLFNIVANIFIVGVGVGLIHKIMNDKCLTKGEYKEDIKEKMEMFSQLVDEKISKVVVKFEIIEKYLKNQINKIEEKIEDD